ncbi:MAG: response regulator [Opitutaceae bacterium]|nr:response regulator [Opitutaceae bacterium]
MNAITTQTILLVEDDENDVVFVRMALEKAGVASGLQVVEDGAQAINYLSGQGDFGDRTRYPLPALVLLDLKLPRVMGIDVLKWIREQRELDMMLVVMLTSSQQRTDIQTACSLGANSYLVKPSNPFDLSEMMELVKRYWLQLNQPTSSSVAFMVPAEAS